GVPVVSTSVGAEGLGFVNGEEIRLRDGPDEFADAIASLLSDPEARRRQAAAARLQGERDYGWRGDGGRVAGGARRPWGGAGRRGGRGAGGGRGGRAGGVSRAGPGRDSARGLVLRRLPAVHPVARVLRGGAVEGAGERGRGERRGPGVGRGRAGRHRGSGARPF